MKLWSRALDPPSTHVRGESKLWCQARPPLRSCTGKGELRLSKPFLQKTALRSSSIGIHRGLHGGAVCSAIEAYVGYFLDIKPESLSCASGEGLQWPKKHILKCTEVTHLPCLSPAPKSLRKKQQTAVNEKKPYSYRLILSHGFIASAGKEMLCSGCGWRLQGDFTNY